MAIEVRIPTILRTYTDGARSVEASGDTLRAVIVDLEANHPGIQERIVDEAVRSGAKVALGGGGPHDPPT